MNKPLRKTLWKQLFSYQFNCENFVLVGSNFGTKSLNLRLYEFDFESFPLLLSIVFSICKPKGPIIICNHILRFSCGFSVTWLCLLEPYFIYIYIYMNDVKQYFRVLICYFCCLNLIIIVIVIILFLFLLLLFLIFLWFGLMVFDIPGELGGF